MASPIDNIINGLTNATTTNPNDSFGGFSSQPIPSADGNGLPSSKVQNYRVGQNTRSLISWFVPEFGVIQMYINPKNISYADKKLINKERTKGGFILQYWGEELTAITLNGTTGSSGIEGINVLHEIYRAEQYAFDGIGLSLAADNANQGAANQIIGGIGNAIGGLASGTSVGSDIGGYIAKSLFGTDPASQALAAQNIPSLAQYAFGVEMYYLGWIYRGYFESMTVRESADNLGLFDYDITFNATERRGYRLNNLSWQKSATSGPSGYNIPLSFGGIKF